MIRAPISKPIVQSFVYLYNCIEKGQCLDKTAFVSSGYLKSDPKQERSCK